MINLTDAKLDYIPCFLAASEAQVLLAALADETPWKEEKIKLFGKWVKQPRLTAWYGDQQAIYTYSGLINYPLPWSDPLLAIKAKIESFTDLSFNSVLLNYYRDGYDYMGWHADNEKELGLKPFIASLSLGAVRRFQVKHRVTKEVITFELESGSLLIMSEEMQEHWLHRVAPTKRPSGPRINLTFRKVTTSGGSS